MADRTIQQLDKAIQGLLKQRQEHIEALEAIDATFQRYGLAGSHAVAKRRGRPRKTRGSSRPQTVVAKRRKGRKRGSFKKTGTESIAQFVKAAGEAGRTGSEISANWVSEGRGSGVYVVLGQLVKAGVIKRKNLKGQRGSRYTAA